MGKVLVACEESQAITIELRKQGIDAYSCDLQPCSGGHPEWHIQGDAIIESYSGKYIAMIAHPTCTFITNSGVCWLYNKDGSRNEERWHNLVKAVKFFNKLKNAPIKYIAVENPIPHKYARDGFSFYTPMMGCVGIGKYDQLIQPYMFGEPESKATCLWLKGLPKLKETNNVKHIWKELPKNQAQRLHYLPPVPERAKLRSKTFKGIAEAIAEQWAGFFKN